MRLLIDEEERHYSIEMTGGGMLCWFLRHDEDRRSGESSHAPGTWEEPQSWT
jgi:hypothetical protein